MKLTLHEIGHNGNDRVFGSDVHMYDVEGLPPGENAKIAEFDHIWRILRWNLEWHGNWTGKYDTPDAALAALHEEISLAAA